MIFRSWGHDLGNGRRYNMLAVLDEFNREALCVLVATKIGAGEVLEELYQLMIRRGTATYLRSDNGPQFIAELLQSWLEKVGVEPICVLPGAPWGNGYPERFNGTRGREVLNAEWFALTRQAQTVIDAGRPQYNRVRPHQSLNMHPPIPETLLGNQMKIGQDQVG